MAYLARLVLVAAAFAVLPWTGRNPARPRPYLPALILLTAGWFLVSAGLNTGISPAAAIQPVAFAAYALFGWRILQESGNDSAAVGKIVIGYTLANCLYSCLSGIQMLSSAPEEYLHRTGRFMGPFVGATIASEAFFGPTLFGLACFAKAWPVTSAALVGAGMLGTFLTGVRSASLIILIEVLLTTGLVMWRGRTVGILKQLVFAVGLLLALTYGYQSTAGHVLVQRLQTDQGDETRLAIWGSGVDALEGMQIVYGLGPRAELAYAISTQGPVYNSAIAWHNTWVAAFVELGLVGLTLYLTAAALALVTLYKRAWRWLGGVPGFEFMDVLALLILLRYVAMSMTEMNMYTAFSPGSMFTWTVLGALAAQYHEPFRRCLGQRQQRISIPRIGRGGDRQPACAGRLERSKS